MKSYTGKTVEEALQAAASEAGVEVDDLIYIVSDKKNDVVIHLFMLSFGQMSIKLLPFILKIGHEERTKEKFIKRKK